MSSNASWARYRFDESNINGPLYFRFYVRVADYPDTTQSIIVLDSTGGGDRAGIRMTPTGTLQLADLDGTGNPIKIGSDSSVLSLNTWYRVELKYDASAGLSAVSLEARLNGTTFASSASITNGNNIARVAWGMIAGAANYDLYWDDIAINTASWPGEGKIVLLRPNAAGDNSGWTLGAGTGANYLQVDEETPDDAGTYLKEASSTGTIADDYNIQDAVSLIGSDARIALVQVGVRGGGTGDLARTFVTRIKASSGGTVEESASIDWSLNNWRTNEEGPNAHNYALTLYDLPAGSTSDWTAADLDSAQIGVRHDAANTNEVRVSAMWLLAEWNPHPVISDISPSSVEVGGSAFVLTVNGTNFVPGSVVRWNGTERPTTYVNSSQLTAQIADSDIAAAGTVSIDVASPSPSSDAATAVSFKVNSSPSATDQSVETDEDIPLAITLGGSDPDLDTLSFATSTSPAHGTLGAISGNQVTYTPAANYFGEDSFEFTASDGALTSPAATVSITIRPVEDAPVISSVTFTPVSPTTDDTLTANVSASDAEGQSITYAYQWKKNGNDVSGATFQSYDLAAAGNGDKGDAISVVVIATDVSGTPSDPFLWGPVTIANSAPLADNLSISVNEDSGTTTITFAASDADGDEPLTFEIVSGPSLGALGEVSENHVTYTPNPDAHGLDSFSYRASDGTAYGEDAVVNITLNSVDDPVILAAVGNKEVDELAELAFTVSASDVDAEEGDISYELINAPDGAAIDASTGEFTWTPSEEQGPGEYDVTFRAASGGQTDEETVTITVNEVNQAPVAESTNVSAATNETTTLTMTASDDDLPANALAYFVVDTPSHGSVGEFSGSEIAYTPVADYSGPDSFTFRVFDGLAYSEAATTTVTVVAAPAASPAPGTYASTRNVTLTAAEDAEILFTLDGSDPACGDDALYEGPIAVTTSKTIRAVACYADDVTSPVRSFAYTINWEADSFQAGDLWSNNILVASTGTSASTTAVTVAEELKVRVGTASGTSTVELPAGTEITKSGGEAFSALDMDARLVAPGTLEVGENDVVKGALEWGIPGITLQFSNPITVRIFVGASLDGQTLNVGRSVTGTGGWTTDGIVPPATCAVDQGLCSFQATKASFYAATTPVVVSSGGGGGGGFVDTTPPGSPTISIVIAKETATSGAAMLTLSAEDAYEMIVADNLEFAGAVWEHYAKEKLWTFVPESGTTTVYVKFRDVSNNETGIVSA
ncbi:MAG: tandem-95 repeat protein, partial [Candidatus Liptonbacteria bacterium]|nr:tandem-95 repeat protein [Candidatus Liptonbacteria bacterium]